MEGSKAALFVNKKAGRRRNKKNFVTLGRGMTQRWRHIASTSIRDFFNPTVWNLAPAAPQPQDRVLRVFWFFFAKKNRF
jgi:hypothetical protein